MTTPNVPRTSASHKLRALYDWLDKYVTNAPGGSAIPSVAAIDQGASLIGYADGTYNWAQVVRPIFVQISQADLLADTPQYVPRPLFNGGGEGGGFGGGGGSIMGYIAVVQKALAGTGSGTHGSIKLQQLSGGTLTDIPGTTNDLGNAGPVAAGTFFQAGTAPWSPLANLGIFDSFVIQPTHGVLTAGAINCVVWVTSFASSGS